MGNGRFYCANWIRGLKLNTPTATDMDEINDILNGFKRPTFIASVNSRLASHPERNENDILQAVRTSVVSTLAGEEPELERFDVHTRRFAFWFILSAFANDSEPWTDEPKLTIKSAQALVFDTPELAEQAGVFLL
jgi:hypothetical protein